MVERLLEVKGLKTYFFTDEGVVRAVDGVDLYINKGETLGVVGESGCGKSVTALSIMRLIPQPPGPIVEGSIHYDGRNLLDLSPSQMRKIRGKEISMIFQEPMTSLNPVFTVGEQIAEALRLHEGLNRRDAMDKTVDMLKLVHIPNAERRVQEYPHQLSGGLLRSIPRIDLAAVKKLKLETIPGTVPTLRGPEKPGCAFAPRCSFAKPMHFDNTPPLKEVRPGHKVACFLY